MLQQWTYVDHTDSLTEAHVSEQLRSLCAESLHEIGPIHVPKKYGYRY